ncbi:hypothetical protein DPX39_080045400 [Trypanosoma brucei equiperdum]|uniref:Uncharacterized protein n=1 Tax=Trypanosoma brucei equiperdum TaxID=630700 RepID=A0A3L6L3S4_9TRYP|nr:hypothetical protein DPX39_080045400 [Trypanosoma brucei equiperdum]
MTFVDLFDMTVAYVQYLYIMVSLSPNSFPEIILQPLSKGQLALLHISYDYLTGDSQKREQMFTLPNWIPHDSRLNYTFIVVIIPMVISLGGFLIVSSTGASLCLFAQVVAVFFTVLGAVLVSTPRAEKMEIMTRETQRILVLAGGVGLIVLFVAGIIYLFMLRRSQKKKRRLEMAADRGAEHREEVSAIQKAVRRVTENKRATSALLAYEAKKEVYVQARRWRSILIQLLVCGIAIAAGYFIYVTLPTEDSAEALKIGRYDKAVAITFFVASSVIVIWALLSISQKGRQIQVKLTDKLSKALTSTALIALSIAFTPVTLNMMRLLVCTEVSCNEGEMMIGMKSAVGGSRNFSNSWDTTEKPCLACNFTEHTQKCSKSLQIKLCGGNIREKRLAYDPRVSCREIDNFYKMSMSLVFIAYFVAYPAFLILSIDRATSILVDEYPLEKRICDEFNKKELYYEKTLMSRNVSSSLYVAFKYQFRRSRILFLLQRILLVLIGVLMRRGPGSVVAWLGISLITCICLVYLTYLMMARPYARPVENWYSISHQLVLTFIGSLGVVGSMSTRELVPNAVTITAVALMIVAPMFALIVGSVLTFRNDRQRVERLQSRLKRDFETVADTAENQSPDNVVVGESLDNPNCKGQATACTDPDLPPRGDGTTVGSAQSPGDMANNPQPGAEVNDSSNGRETGLPAQNPQVLASLPAAGGGVKGDNTRQRSGNRADREGAPASGPSDGADIGTAVVFADEHNAPEETDKKEKAMKDDYFGDKRSFEPQEYFRGYKEVPLSHDCGEGEGEGEGGGMDDELYEQTAVKRGELKAVLSSLIREGDDYLPDDGYPPGVAVPSNALDGWRHETQHGEEYDSAKKEDDATKGRPSCFSVMLRWMRQCGKAFHVHSNTLRYGEVLQSRRTLKMTAGIAERPFWITPSESQFLAAKAEGCDVPAIRQSAGGDEGPSGLYEPSQFFAKLVEHKKKCWNPLVGPSSRAVTAAKTAKEDSGKAKGPNSPSSALAVVASNLPVAKEGNVNPYGQTITSDVSDRISAMLSKEQLCAALAELKAADLDRLLPRDLKDTTVTERRPSICPEFAPHVALEGESEGNWEAFVQRLLEDIPDPLEKYRETGSRESAEAEGSPKDTTTGRRQSVTLDTALKMAGSPSAKRKSRMDVSSARALVRGAANMNAENMPKLRRHYLLRQQLVDEYNSEAGKLESLQMAVDHRIAMSIRRYMQIFFVVLCLFSTLSLAMCIGGMMYKGDNISLTNAQSAYSVHNQLFGYKSWEEFTRNCCCSSLSSPAALPPNNVMALERWVCRNRLVKERVRRDVLKGEAVDGFKIRELCGMDFKNGCKLKLHPKGRVEIENCTTPVTEQEILRW